MVMGQYPKKVPGWYLFFSYLVNMNGSPNMVTIGFDPSPYELYEPGYINLTWLCRASKVSHLSSCFTCDSDNIGCPHDFRSGIPSLSYWYPLVN